MTQNAPDSEALLLDQTYFALDVEGFAMFQELVDNPPTATTSLRRTLRRMDAVLKPTKQAALSTKQMLDDVRVVHQAAVALGLPGVQGLLQGV